MSRFPGPRTLRARLLVAALTLVVMALAAVNVVAWLTVRDSVLGAIDSQLLSIPGGGPRRAPPAGAGVTLPRDVPPLRSVSGSNQDLLSNLVVTTLDPGTGRQLDQVAGPTQRNAPKPDLAAVSRDITAGVSHDVLLTVPSLTDSGYRYRYRVRVIPGQTRVMAIATSLEAADTTVRRVVLLDLGISGLVVVALLGVGLVVIRIGLRPLAEVEEAADRLAAGDLSVRVNHSDERSEVGRLARSFNRMVEQIDEAFQARDAGEHQLRSFLADASHELRTPLTSIRAYAELFGQQILHAPPESATALARIESEAQRMSRLVDDLLTLARLDQHQPLAHEPVDLHELVEHAVQDSAAAAPGHRIRFAPRSDPDAGTVTGDEAGLTQVVTNLLGNALQHTPAGTTVTVSLHHNGAGVVLEVADDGPGMPPDVAERVFDRFYRPDAGRSRDTGSRSGTGLGLAIVKSQAEAHGGTVLLDTQPGDGCRFVVTLPAVARTGA
jgi:two-component system, OmpR family, sensor kinase